MGIWGKAGMGLDEAQKILSKDFKDLNFAEKMAVGANDLAIKGEDSITTRAFKMLLNPIKSIERAFAATDKNGRKLLKAQKVVRKAERAEEIKSMGKARYLARQSGRTFKALAAIPIALGTGYLAKKALSNLFGSKSGGAGVPKSSTPSFDPIPTPSAPPDQSGSDIGRQISKSNKDQQKNDLETKLAEAKAEEYAAAKQSSKIHDLQSQLPDNLRQINARSDTTNGRLDAIIELLNQQNQIENETRRSSLSQTKLQQDEVRYKLSHSSELYRNLSKLQAQQNTANADAVNAMREQGRQQMSAMSGMMKSQNRQIESQNKKSSLMKWALFGGILLGLNHLLESQGGIIGAIGKGVGFIGDGLTNVLEFLGIKNKVGSKIDSSDLNSIDPNSEQAKPLKDRSADFIKNQANAAKQTGTDVSQKTLDRITDKEGNLDYERAAREGVNAKYDAEGVNRGNRIGGGLLLGSAGLNAITGTFGTAKTLWKAGRDARSAGKILGNKAEGKWYTTDEYLKEAKQARKEAEALKSAEKSGNWFTKTIGKARDWIGNTRFAKSVRNIYGRAVKAVGVGTWRLLEKCIGKSNAKLFRAAIEKAGAQAAKAAASNSGKLVSKWIPGVGLIISLIDAAIRGFKDGDWVGAVISTLSGVCSIGGPATVWASMILDGINIARDIHSSNQAEKDAKEANAILNQLKKQGRYSENKKGNIYSEVIKSFGDTHDDPRLDRKKSELIKKLKELGDRARKYKYKNTQREFDEANELLKEYDVKLRYNEKHQLVGYKKGSAVPTNYDKFGEIKEDDIALVSEEGPEFIINPDDNEHHDIIEGIRPLDKNSIYITPQSTTATYVRKGSVIIPNAKKDKYGKIDPESNYYKIANEKGLLAAYRKYIKDNNKTEDPNIVRTINKKNVKKNSIPGVDKKTGTIDLGYIKVDFNTLKRLLENRKKDRENNDQYDQTADGSNFNGAFQLSDIPQTVEYKKFDVSKAINTINGNAIGVNQFQHHCARNVREAIEAGFGNGIAHPINAKDYIRYLPNYGFAPVPFEGYKALPGDVILYPNPNSPMAPGHIAMFNGQNWVSDTIQRSAWVYGQERTGNKVGVIFRNTKAVGLSNLRQYAKGSAKINHRYLSTKPYTLEGLGTFNKKYYALQNDRVLMDKSHGKKRSILTEHRDEKGNKTYSLRYSKDGGKTWSISSGTSFAPRASWSNGNTGQDIYDLMFSSIGAEPHFDKNDLRKGWEVKGHGKHGFVSFGRDGRPYINDKQSNLSALLEAYFGYNPKHVKLVKNTKNFPNYISEPVKYEEKKKKKGIVYDDNAFQKLGATKDAYTGSTGIKDWDNLDPFSKRQAYALAYLVNRYGFTPEAAAGVVGNFAHESYLAPGQHQAGGGGGLGLAQWTGSRRKELDAYFSGIGGGDKATLKQQLDYAVREMMGKKFKMNDYKEITNVAEATQRFERLYEKAGTIAAASRHKYAKGALDLYNKLNANGKRFWYSPTVNAVGNATGAATGAGGAMGDSNWTDQIEGLAKDFGDSTINAWGEFWNSTIGKAFNGAWDKFKPEEAKTSAAFTGYGSRTWNQKHRKNAFLQSEQRSGRVYSEYNTGNNTETLKSFGERVIDKINYINKTSALGSETAVIKGYDGRGRVNHKLSATHIETIADTKLNSEAKVNQSQNNGSGNNQTSSNEVKANNINYSGGNIIKGGDNHIIINNNNFTQDTNSAKSEQYSRSI